MSEFKCQLFKVLSRNDTGETRSHQSGIAIPKGLSNSPIFPDLGRERLNPRTTIHFLDEEDNLWEFQLIYYNDIYFGKPRNRGHNEYRITCVKDFLQYYNAKAGDQIWFGITKTGERMIGHIKQGTEKKEKAFEEKDGVVVIKLGSSWTSVNI